MKPRGLLSAAMCIARKDLREFSRDGVGLLLAFLLPLVLVAVFGFIMGRVGGGGAPMPRVDLALLDLDRTEQSAALVTALLASDTLDVVRPGPDSAPWDEADVRERISSGEDPYGMVIPQGYAEGADLILLRDPGRDLEEQLVLMSLVGALFDAGGEDFAWEMSKRGLEASGLPPELTGRIEAVVNGFRFAVEAMFDEAQANGSFDEDAAFGGGDGADDDGADGDGENAGNAGDAAGGNAVGMAEILQLTLPLELVDVAPEGRDAQLGYQVTHAVSGMTVMMLLFSLVGFGRSLLIERDKGTLVRLLSAPVPKSSILLGKLLATFFTGLLLVFVLFGFAHVVFDIDMVSRFDTLLVLTLVNCLACTAFAAAIAGWARTEKQADGVSVLLILTMSALGGSWMPSMMMPEAAQAVGRFTLTYWSLRGYQGTFWYGQHWTDPEMLQSMGVVLAIAVVLLALASRLFRTRYVRT